MGRNWMEPGGQWDMKENPLPYVVELREGEWTEGSGQAGGGAYPATGYNVHPHLSNPKLTQELHIHEQMRRFRAHWCRRLR